MKLSFKEWSIIYAALTEKLDSIASSIKWQKEYEAENDEESDTMKQYKAEQAELLAIIRKLETCAI